jgi:hypothetical protein
MGVGVTIGITIPVSVKYFILAFISGIPQGSESDSWQYYF